MVDTHTEKRVNLNKENYVSQLQSEIEYTAELLHPMKSSSTNLARILNSTLDATNISFSDVETKVSVCTSCSSHQNQMLHTLSHAEVF